MKNISKMLYFRINHSSYGLASKAFIICVAVLCILSKVSAYLLFHEDQDWTQYSKCGSTNAVQSGTITFCDLDATPLLMQLRTALAFLVAADS